VHGAVASLALGEEKTTAVLADYRTAPIDEKLRATLAFLEKVTLRHAEVTPADAAAARAAGATAVELEEALYVCFLFNIYDRLADSMGWITRDDARYVRDARYLLKRGYEPGAPNEVAADARRALERAVLEGPGVTPPSLRQAAARGGEVPESLAKLVAKTRDHAYKVTDEEIAALRARHSDDELFEVIVAAAVGAAGARADAGFAALAGQAAAAQAAVNP
jgi:alkylhydroperoxidase family enzyme